MVFLPAINQPDEDLLDTLHYLLPRRGGGGGGRGGGGGGKSSSGGGSKGSSGGKGGKSSSSGGKGSRGTTAGAFAFGAGAGVGSGYYVHPYAYGGGHSRPLDQASPFAGRESGNGTREQVFGTSRYGSGYPYGASGNVSGRPFPFVFWPVPIAVGYFGAETYLDFPDNIRPGGNISTVSIVSTLSSTPEVYRLVGDRSSLSPVLDALVTNCSVTNASLSLFDPRASSAHPLPAEVVQWYRASSFALALDGHTNLASSATNISADPPLPLSLDTPLPAALNATFLACLNATIGAAVPLLASAKFNKLSAGAIAGIVIGSIAALILVVVAIVLLLKRRKANRVHSKRLEIIAARSRDAGAAEEKVRWGGLTLVSKLPGMGKKTEKGSPAFGDLLLPTSEKMTTEHISTTPIEKTPMDVSRT